MTAFDPCRRLYFNRAPRDNRQNVAKRFDYEESDGEYNYAKLLRSPEWREKRKEIIAKSLRCQKCGRTGRRLTVHHSYYDYGRLPWDYPDEAHMVVCNGRCHREADEDREEQQRDAGNYKLFGWQWELGKACQRPNKRELRRLAKYEAEFKAWLIRNEILHESWNWEAQPLWYLWNLLSEEFLAKRRNNNRQGHLDI